MIEWLPSKPGTPMNKLGGARRFQQLPADAQARHIGISQHLTRLARDHAVPIVFAPPPSIGGKINSASCVLQLDAGTFVVTASHVLIGYEERIRSGEVLHWLVGNLPPFDPLQRVAWRGADRLRGVRRRTHEGNPVEAVDSRAGILVRLVRVSPPDPSVRLGIRALTFDPQRGRDLRAAI